MLSYKIIYKFKYILNFTFNSLKTETISKINTKSQQILANSIKI